MIIKSFIKVPLVLLENVTFSIFPHLRPLIEQYFFNPLDFKEGHIKYSQKKFEEFRKYTQTFTPLEGKTILELGPGGSLGFGLLALEKGAEKYIALDDGKHTFVERKQILHYAKLVSDRSQLNRYFILQNKKILCNPQKIEYVGINQESKYPLPDNSIDIIYSCAVLEHVHDLALCFSEMSRVLKEGGIMYHEVDLRDHIFSQENLWFLTINDFWFRILFSKTGGYVNRKRISEYKKLAHHYHLDIISFNSTHRYKKAKWPSSLNDLSSEDRETLSFIIVLQKNVS